MVQDLAESHWPEYVDVVIDEPLLDSTTEVGAGAKGRPVASLKVNVYWNCLSNCAVKDDAPV